jgi:hypothetical protein
MHLLTLPVCFRKKLKSSTCGPPKHIASLIYAHQKGLSHELSFSAMNRPLETMSCRF